MHNNNSSAITNNKDGINEKKREVNSLFTRWIERETERHVETRDGIRIQIDGPLVVIFHLN